jgi:hypothetical protein
VTCTVPHPQLYNVWTFILQANLKDTERLCSKLTEDVVKKEIKKYRDSRIQGTVKSILRSRLLDKVVSYVDMQVMMYTEKKSISENRH